MKILYASFILLFASIQLQAQISSFRVAIFVQTGENYSSQNYLGVNPGNTIGLDTSKSLGDYKETLLPPQPPTFPFSVRYRTIPGRPSLPPAGLFTGVDHDYRGFFSTSQIDSFKIEITGDSLETNATTISWGGDLSLYADEWIIKPQNGADFPETNMLTKSFVTFPKGPSSRSAFIIKTGAKIILSINEIKNIIPGQFSLEQNYPNPFNPVTIISYSVPDGAISSQVKLMVYDVLGREVATLVNKEMKAGMYEIQFNGSNLPSGIYFYSIIANNFSKVKKMLMIK